MAEFPTATMVPAATLAADDDYTLPVGEPNGPPRVTSIANLSAAVFQRLLGVGDTLPATANDGEFYIRKGNTAPGLYHRESGEWINILAPGSGVTGGGYKYYQAFSINPALTKLASSGDGTQGSPYLWSLPATGDGLKIPIIDEQVVPGGLVTYADFETMLEGALFVTSTVGTGLRVLFEFTHIIPARGVLPERRFTSIRERPYYNIGADDPFWISLNDFSNSTRIPVGTFTVGGQDITVEQADLDAPSRIRYDIELIGTASRNVGNRQARTLSAIEFFRSKVRFWQLAGVNAPAVKSGTVHEAGNTEFSEEFSAEFA